MAIGRESLFTLTHYEYGEAYFGSYRGMRYRVAREPFVDVHFLQGEARQEADASARLTATVWPEPFSYANTAPELMSRREFEFSEEGMESLAAWMNSEYEARLKDWNR